MARRIGSLLVLALDQRAELRGVVEEDGDVPAVIAADEQVHARVVAGLARSRRARASGLLRASVFGANDGLVSNLSLVLGVAAAGVAPEIVLLTGIAGLLAGALSMAAGEYVSVRSQRELVDARPPRLEPAALAALREEGPGELALAFRAEGLPPEEADRRAAALLAGALEDEPPPVGGDEDADLIGTAAGAAGSSFVSFATGAALPLIPFVLAEGTTAVVAAVVLAGASLFVAGALAGVLSGGPLLRRGARQLGIGLGAAAVTYALGSLFGVTLG
jgi:VIT1/CCC1 family predicted Fe2+/Mn2+ transporter